MAAHASIDRVGSKWRVRWRRRGGSGNFLKPLAFAEQTDAMLAKSLAEAAKLDISPDQVRTIMATLRGRQESRRAELRQQLDRVERQRQELMVEWLAVTGTPWSNS